MMLVKIKKQEAKKSVSQMKSKFRNCKNRLEATQLDNKVNYLEKIKININSFKKITKIHKKHRILKTQPRLKSERHNVFLKKSKWLPYAA